MAESPSIIEARTHANADGERARADLVDELELVGSPNVHLDVVARRAARLMDTSIGAVTVLLRHEQHLIARAGTDARVTDRETSFCTHVTARRQPLTIRDATRAPFFCGNPVVGFTTDHIRAYCGVPITSGDGTVLAVLCAADPRPRNFSEAQIAMLVGLAESARVMLVPMSLAPPTRVRPPLLDTARIDDSPAAWCSQDDLSSWIDQNIPEEHELAVEAHRRSERRWPSRLVRTAHGRSAHVRP